MIKNKVIKKAKEELDYLTGDDETRRLEELRDKAIRDEKTNLRGAKEEGREEGKLEGRIEGKYEAKTEIVKQMLKQKTNIEFIVNVTGLTKEEIKKIISAE
mgnify:CR=1 FL=1